MAASIDSALRRIRWTFQPSSRPTSASPLRTERNAARSSGLMKAASGLPTMNGGGTFSRAAADFAGRSTEQGRQRNGALDRDSSPVGGRDVQVPVGVLAGQAGADRGHESLDRQSDLQIQEVLPGRFLAAHSPEVFRVMIPR